MNVKAMFPVSKCFGHGHDDAFKYVFKHSVGIS